MADHQHAETSTTAAADTATVAAAIAGIGSGTRRVERLLVELPSGRRLQFNELQETAMGVETLIDHNAASRTAPCL